MHVLRKHQRGQGQTEYILMLALVSIVILGGLFAYREAVKGLLCRVIVALGGNPGDCGSGTAPAPNPPPNPAPAATSTPAPTATPTPASSPFPLNLAGRWCVFISSFGGRGLGPGGSAYTQTFVPLGNGTFSTEQPGVVVPTGPDRFEFRSPSGSTEGPYVRQPDGSYQYTNRRPELITLRRC